MLFSDIMSETGMSDLESNTHSNFLLKPENEDLLHEIEMSKVRIQAKLSVKDLEVLVNHDKVLIKDKICVMGIKYLFNHHLMTQIEALQDLTHEVLNSGKRYTKRFKVVETSSWSDFRDNVERFCMSMEPVIFIELSEETRVREYASKEFKDVKTMFKSCKKFEMKELIDDVDLGFFIDDLRDTKHVKLMILKTEEYLKELLGLIN